MRQSRRMLTLVVLGMLLCPLARADEFSGKVVGITDGDTISVLRDSKPETIRLDGIDCPEQGQAFGDRARQYTSALCFGDVVTVKAGSKDFYGRTIATIVLTDGRILNQELVKAGFAWWYKDFSQDVTLGKLEQEAREKKYGLWSDPNPVAPWEYRKPQTPKQLVYIGSTGREYHKENCERLGENRSGLDPATAAAAGYSPCLVCEPPARTTTPPKQEQARPEVQSKETQGATVYITNTGAKYHRETCRYLSKSKIPISLEAAAAKGYTPCSVCGPPAATGSQTDPAQPAATVQEKQEPAKASQTAEQTVYITRTGAKYHRGGCRYLSKSMIPISLEDAKKRGYGPCSVCAPPTSSLSAPQYDGFSKSSAYYSLPSSGVKDVYVRGYYRKDGTYVRSHYRSRPKK